MARFLWICLGGAIGTAARYLISLGSLRALGAGFPYGTLIVNVIGSFLIGLIMTASLHGAAISQTLRMALTTGFLGGLTTYSSFNYETLALCQKGLWPLGLLNFAVTTAGCALAGLAGVLSGRWIAGG